MPLSSYSSTYNSNIMSFYNRTGYSSCSRLITWCEPLLPSDSLLGIKYILSDIDSLGYIKSDDSLYNGKSIYQNPYALNLGYQVSEDIFEKISAANTFEYQNQLLSKLVGHEVTCFKPCTSTVQHLNDGYSWEVSAPQKSSLIYGYCTYALGNQLDLYIDNKQRTYYSEWSSYKTFQVGNGDSPNHLVELKGTLNRDTEIEGVFYYLDMPEFENVMSELSANQVDVLELRDGYVKCEANFSENALTLLTVPYDSGWNAYINGKKVSIRKLQDIFIGLEVPSGSNIIELKFTLPGFKTGLIASFIGISIYILLLLFINHKNFILKQK